MKNQFFIYMSQNVKKMYILGYLGGPEGVFNDQTGPILLSSYPLTHIHVQVKQGNNLIGFFNLNPKYEKNIYFFSYLGVLGGPYVEPR